MPVKPVLKIGNPVLRQVASPVDTIDEPLRQGIIQDMLDTMKDLDGAGIAAPQIGESLKIIIFGIEKNPRYPDVEPVPTTILINPTFEVLSDDRESAWEGCLSVPGFRGRVPRFSRIKYSGLDEYGQPLEREVRGFHARVFLHEYDHLEGILYPDRVVDMKDFGLIEELEAAELIPRIPDE